MVGIAAGHFLPGLFQALAMVEYAKVNLPMAVLIWPMIVPMLVRIDFVSLRQVSTYWRGIGITLWPALKADPYGGPFPPAILRTWVYALFGIFFADAIPRDCAGRPRHIPVTFPETR